MRTTPATPVLGVGYIRNSKLNGRERGNNASVREQRRGIEQYAAQNGIDLTDIIEEEDTSGSTLDRPGWLRARQLVSDGTVQAIVGWDLDRLSRDESWHTMAAVADIEAEGGQVHDRTGRITVGTFEGEAVATLRSMMNRAEWRKIRERNNGNVYNAIVVNGAHLTAPYGYRKPSKGAVLAIDEREAPAVRLAYQLRGDGWSWAAIANALNDTPHQPRRSPHWSGPHVSAMLRNPVYMGTAWHGEHVKPDAHAKIVSAAVWNKANRVRGRKFGGDERRTYLLSGLVRCASCGYAMTHTRRSAKQGGWRYYQCQRKAGVQCPAPTSVPAAELEAHVLDQFKAQVLTLRAYRPVTDDAQLIEAEAALADAEEQLRTIAVNRLQLGTDVSATERSVVDDLLAQARARVASCEQAVTQARTQAAGIDLPTDLNADAIEAEPIEQQRHLVGLVFAAVVVGKPSRWRQPANERVVFLGRNEAPHGDIIGHVVALDWDPAGAWVATG